MKKISLVLTFVLACFLANAQPTPRPEYPRPQFERSSWVNLNGTWTYAFDFGNSGHNRGFSKTEAFENKIVVPFCPESKLSGVEYKDFINNIWYQRKINIPSVWNGKKIILHFGAVDYKSEVFIDGTLVGKHFGGTSSFEFDITAFVKPGAEHNMVVYANDELRSGKQTGGKQCFNYFSEGCSYTRTTGIWQTVWMEAIAPVGLKSVQVVPDLDQKQILVRPSFLNESATASLKITLKDNGKVVAQKVVKASNQAVCVLNLPNVKTWSPESPFLYDIVYEVSDKDNKVVDVVNSYVGMRKVHIEGTRIFLNNQPYYQRLVLDQGFYPDGIWTAPTDVDLKKDIELSMAAGFNGARLHQKVFEERFHYWADKLGYLTWGESSSWGSDYNDVEAARNFISEWSEIIVRDRNHPSIITWTPFNESWEPRGEQYPRFVHDIYNITKGLDNTRPVNDASGGTHVITDIWTVHNYEQNGEKLAGILTPGTDGKMFSNDRYSLAPYAGQPYLIDEFGGIRWIPTAKDKNSENSWGYGDAPKSLEEYYTRLEGQVDAILSRPNVWGYCFTQLTDVEQEQNGIYLYNRSSKFDMTRIHKIFSKIPAFK
ncbi:MAG TPA: glycoside hydrolase family 2 TIM barrel-domain containing protein [Bacteroidales bacterium]|nr:glycoside hydrolase family 2 TIM barrel-domain containing protein [Bacteroidales bacterium]